MSTATIDDKQIDAKVNRALRVRCREAGLSSRTIGSLTPAEQEKYSQLLVDTLREENRLREGVTTGDLLDLSEDGVPMVGEDGEPRAAVAVVEQLDDKGMVDLTGSGVPLVEPRSRPFGRRQRTPGPMREATYGADGQPQVHYEDGDTYRDCTDLYTVIKNDLGTGSESLENQQASNLVALMKEGYPLSDVQVGLLQRLLAKYKPQIEALRASPDKEGQDYTDVPEPATARLVPEDPMSESDADGPLLDAEEWLHPPVSSEVGSDGLHDLSGDVPMVDGSDASGDEAGGEVDGDLIDLTADGVPSSEVKRRSAADLLAEADREDAAEREEVQR